MAPDSNKKTRPCKNCGDDTIFPTTVDAERDSKGWCVPCYRHWLNHRRVKDGREFWIDYGQTKEGFGFQYSGTQSQTATGTCHECGEQSDRLNPAQCREFAGWCTSCTVRYHRVRKTVERDRKRA